MADVTVIDYGTGNLASVRRALEECGASVAFAGVPTELDPASRILLPGVGAFADAMFHLRERGWEAAIRRAASNGVPILGICLGMQLLMDSGTEGGTIDGLGLIPGTVKRFVPLDDERIPHVGWNEVHLRGRNALIESVPDRTDFYFVHSFHVEPAERGDVLASTPYVTDFASIVARSNVYGAQFHPEKSGGAGFRLLGNFLSL